jgi:membrane fusion protein (multidrug efflux system)
MLRIITTIITTLLIMAAIAGSLGYIKFAQFSAMGQAAENMQFPAFSVATDSVETMEWQNSVNAIGSIVAVQGVTVTTESPGKVESINFESGAMIKAGDVMVELDITVETAQLNSAKATARLAEINLERTQKLFDSNTISRAELDSAIAASDESKAVVANIEAQIDRKTIKAPFDGKLGIRQVNLGQFLGSGEGIVSLQTVDPVYVDFFVPQQNLKWMEVGQVVTVSSDASEIGEFEGTVTAIASEIDRNTRNVLVRATIEGTEGQLIPGSFVSTQIYYPETETVLIVPATSVVYATFGNSVFVVVDDGNGMLTAQQKFVQLGRRQGDFVEVTQGLELGEQVISDGGFKLFPGAPIQINNDAAPERSLNPTPEEA